MFPTYSHGKEPQHLKNTTTTNSNKFIDYTQLSLTIDPGIFHFDFIEILIFWTGC